jgi:hypothetical protein
MPVGALPFDWKTLETPGQKSYSLASRHWPQVIPAVHQNIKNVSPTSMTTLVSSAPEETFAI